MAISGVLNGNITIQATPPQDNIPNGHAYFWYSRSTATWHFQTTPNVKKVRVQLNHHYHYNQSIDYDNIVSITPNSNGVHVITMTALWNDGYHTWYDFKIDGKTIHKNDNNPNRGVDVNIWWSNSIQNS